MALDLIDIQNPAKFMTPYVANLHARFCRDRVDTLLIMSMIRMYQMDRDLSAYNKQTIRWKVCEELLLWMIERNHSDPQAVEYFDHLVAQCPEAHFLSLRGVVRDVMIRGCVEQFEVLVYSKNITSRLQQAVICRLIEQHMVHLVLYACMHRLYLSCFSGKVPDYNGCLAVAWEAGVFATAVTETRPVYMSLELTDDRMTALGVAVHYNQPDLVRFLHSCGAASYRELIQLIRHPLLQPAARASSVVLNMLPAPKEGYPPARDVASAQIIHDFLTSAASMPRTLENICLHFLSRRLGWGSRRKAKLEQLEIPLVLKEHFKWVSNC